MSIQHAFQSLNITTLKTAGTSAMLAGALLLTGCDSSGNGGSASQSAQISGQVTTNTTSSSSAAPASMAKAGKAAVEGAAVTAVHVRQDGSTQSLQGQAMTSAEGRYSIDLEGDGAQGIVLLRAAKQSSGFASSLIVDTNGRSQVSVPTMTAETHSEAEAYTEAERDDDDGAEGGNVTTADAAIYVDARVAADMEAGNTSASDVALALRQSAEAQASFNGEADGGADGEAVANEKSRLFVNLQSELASASNAEARTAAVQAFEEAMADVYAEAGATAETQARTLRIGATALVNAPAEASSEAATGMRDQAELLVAYSTAQAVEARFKAEGVAQSRLDALADARAKLIADLRSGATTAAEAKAAYEAEVEAQMREAFSLSLTALTTAKASAETAAAALDTALASASDADAIASAYVTFYADATASVNSTLSANAKAETATSVLVLLSAF